MVGLRRVIVRVGGRIVVGRIVCRIGGRIVALRAAGNWGRAADRCRARRRRVRAWRWPSDFSASTGVGGGPVSLSPPPAVKVPGTGSTAGWATRPSADQPPRTSAATISTGTVGDKGGDLARRPCSFREPTPDWRAEHRRRAATHGSIWRRNRQPRPDRGIVDLAEVPGQQLVGHPEPGEIRVQAGALVRRSRRLRRTAR